VGNNIDIENGRALLTYVRDVLWHILESTCFGEGARTMRPASKKAKEFIRLPA
jgi:hypothetical protein